MRYPAEAVDELLGLTRERATEEALAFDRDDLTRFPAAAGKHALAKRSSRVATG